MKDKELKDDLKFRLRKKKGASLELDLRTSLDYWGVLLILYPLIFLPFLFIDISMLTDYFKIFDDSRFFTRYYTDLDSRMKSILIYVIRAPLYLNFILPSILGVLSLLNDKGTFFRYISRIFMFFSCYFLLVNADSIGYRLDLISENYIFIVLALVNLYIGLIAYSKAQHFKDYQIILKYSYFERTSNFFKRLMRQD